MYNLSITKILTLCFFVIILVLINGCENPSEKTETSVYPEAEKQNVDSNQLAIAFTNAEEIGDLQGLAVARNNVIVAEEYFNGAGPDPDPDLHVMSVTKSISATLIGIAIDKGFIASVDQTIGYYLGEEVEPINPALGEVTIRQLLTMTCGHDWHELGSYSEFGNWVNASDQLIYIYQKPIVNTPGTVFNYSDGGAHLISAILQEATGMNTATFATQFLFRPMGLDERIWYTDNRGIPYGGVGLCLGIHDMIKIGYLYLNDGNFNGEQIVSAEWIADAGSMQISTDNAIPFLRDYGYFWWFSSAHGHEFICANGYGGQFILVAKNLNLVIASRSDYRGINRDQAGSNWYQILNIIINQILPAVRVVAKTVNSDK